MGRKRDLENKNQNKRKPGSRANKRQQDPISFKTLQKNLKKSNPGKFY